MANPIDEAGVRARPDLWDKAMDNTDGELLGSLFAEDGELMLENTESIVSRNSITEVVVAGFEANNFTGWSVDYHTFQVHERDAYVLGDFDFDVFPYDGRQAVRHVGRGVWFWRRTADGTWQLAFVISARRSKSVPIESSDR